MATETWTPSHLPDLYGRTAVVTGASGGLGADTARALAGAGARVVLAVRDPERGRAALEQVRSLGRAELVQLDLADQARDALASSVESLQLQRAGDLPYTTIVAHSYGSTAALMALTQFSFKVNALVLVGTPGSAAQSAKDLHVKNTNVWVGAAAWDPVPTSAFFGSDPSAPSYGAHTMGVNGGTDVITGTQLGQSLGHNEYFDPNTESIRNMALIAIDQAGLVMQDNAGDTHRTLASAK